MLESHDLSTRKVFHHPLAQDTELSTGRAGRADPTNSSQNAPARRERAWAEIRSKWGTMGKESFCWFRRPASPTPPPPPPPHHHHHYHGLPGACAHFSRKFESRSSSTSVFLGFRTSIGPRAFLAKWLSSLRAQLLRKAGRAEELGLRMWPSQKCVCHHLRA